MMPDYDRQLAQEGVMNAGEQGRLVANLRAALAHLVDVNGELVDPVPAEAQAFLAGIGCDATPAAVRTRARVEQQRLNNIRRTP